MITLKINNYKCFADEFQGFDKIYPINILIGRNNSGKSSLLDLLNAVCNEYDLQVNARNNKNSEILITCPIPEETIRRIFRPDTSGGIIGQNHFQFGSQWIGKPITFSMFRKTKKYVSIYPEMDERIRNSYIQRILEETPNPFSSMIFRQLKAERRILPEIDSEIKLESDGSGATNIIQHFINKYGLPSELIEDRLLSELNKIFNPDANFTDIVVQQLKNNQWEIFLEEDEKGRIALSQSGSGLQTVLLVLINIHLLPIIEKKPLSNYIFGFEELENNLHPSLQRKLLNYIKEIAILNKNYFFITTHSSVVIDLFHNDQNAQLLHLVYKDNDTKVQCVKTYVEQKGILDDLDVRASDLLQSNCIVWLEGPSDRIYFNRWVELFSNSILQEGNHYQCVFYGGRLLSHLSADVTLDEHKKYIQILLVNRNSILLMDSDKRFQSAQINETKKRIVDEMENVGCYSMITKGREIENYIPVAALEKLYNLNNLPILDKYESFSEYLDKIKSGEGKRFLNNKVLFAEEIRSKIELKELEEVLDIKQKMSEIISYIKKCNSINS